MNFWKYLQFGWIFFSSLTLIGIILTLIFSDLDFSLDWRTANRTSSNIAPDPLQYKNAIVQIYAARAYGWRGLFAVHTWVSVKEKNAENYTVYQVIGWRSFYNLPPLSAEKDIPDRVWFGQKPRLLKDIRDKKAEDIIKKIIKAAKEYPYRDKYLFWPGPNSNTFTAFLARSIPTLRLSLPPSAIGKDYLGKKIISRAPSNTGYQFMFFNLFGVLIAKDEGLEINILGLVFGINFKKLRVILPGIG